jgi:enoyl-CoA hydratase/carnithine racemase
VTGIDTPPASSNGHGADTWWQTWSHLRVDRRSTRYCRVTFAHPPSNTVTATTVAELAEVVELIEHDGDLNVVVFASANPDFYLAERDVERDPARWLEALVRLARAPVVSIAAIRGRAGGAGSEFALACDLRFASRENTQLGPPAGGGPLERLPRLVGRGRALEILLGGDCDGPRAEQYGYVNRTIADARLDDAIDALAARLAGFDYDAIGRVKSYVDRVAT